MDTFDYIEVGGGTAGSVITARLSQDPGTSVLVLEAGAAQPSAGMASSLDWPSLTRTSVDWGDETVALSGTDGAVHTWVRGKVPGGSSGMMHIRGDRAAYDAWDRAGAKGWNYDSLLPFMKRSERAEGDPAYRGNDGPMRVAPASATDRCGTPASRRPWKRVIPSPRTATARWQREPTKRSASCREPLIVVGSQAPIAFFTYPDQPLELPPEGCTPLILAHPQQDGPGALEAVADAIGAHKPPDLCENRPPEVPARGPLDAEKIMRLGETPTTPAVFGPDQ